MIRFRARSQPAGAHRAAPFVAAFLVAIAGFAVFSGALAYFFSQDDFVGLARAQGLVPQLDAPWRYLSRQVFFDSLYAIAGLDARPYHLANLLGHAITCAMLCAWLARRVAPPAALLGAMFFAVHPSLFTALYWVAAHGEIYALLFALLAFGLAAGPQRARRWLAVPCFVVSLLFKESTLLLPIAVAAHVWVDGRDRIAEGVRAPTRAVRADPVWLALVAVAVLYAVSFVATNAFGVTSGLAEWAPYAVSLDAALPNLLTYLAWTLNFTLVTVHSFSDAADPSSFPIGIGAAIVWLAGLFVAGLRSRGWLAGGVIFIVFLVPVLPLRNHTYHYYLYAALAGAAWCVAALADQLLARFAAARSSTVAWSIAALLATALAINGTLLVRKIEHYPFRYVELRSDPTVDRALIAARVREDLRAAALPDSVRLLFWSPTAIHAQRAAGRDTASESYLEHNVRDALQDGLAVRVMFPNVREVSFVRSFRPVDDDTRYVVYRLDGRLRVGRSDEIAGALEALEER